MELSRSEEHMLSGFFDFRFEEREAFVGSADGFDHFGKLAWDERLNSDFDCWLCPEFERDHNVDVVRVLEFSIDDGGSFHDCLIDSFN